MSAFRSILSGMVFLVYSTAAHAAPIECSLSVTSGWVYLRFSAEAGKPYFFETATNPAVGWRNYTSPPDAFAASTNSMMIILPVEPGTAFFRVGELVYVPTNMVLVSGRSFVMGDVLADGYADEPVHTVMHVSAFYMDKYEVTKALWDSVRDWAVTNGYQFDGDLSYTGTNRPVYGLTWYDAVKWCNARSEKEGLTPAYYLSAAQTTVFRSGQLDVPNTAVKWTANGYRLPTEAEWEKAARGGTPGHRFPWSHTDTITHTNANYYSDLSYSIPYDVSATRGCHPMYACAVAPVGSFPTNGFGLCDMAGNVAEWCWDWYETYWYTNTVASQVNPIGPASSSFGARVIRGGGAGESVTRSRCARRISAPPDRQSFGGSPGFRCVRGL